MKYIEYEESFGKFSYPDGFEATLDGLTVEEQLNRFRTTTYTRFANTGWMERTIDGRGNRVENDGDVRAVVVKDGKIVGVMINDDNGRDVFCSPEDYVCTYYAEDNNGAGSKTRADFTYLVCVSEDYNK